MYQHAGFLYDVASNVQTFSTIRVKQTLKSDELSSSSTPQNARSTTEQRSSVNSSDICVSSCAPHRHDLANFSLLLTTDQVFVTLDLICANICECDGSYNIRKFGRNKKTL